MDDKCSKKQIIVPVGDCAVIVPHWVIILAAIVVIIAAIVIAVQGGSQ
jgi:hypothetical protein